MSCAHSGAHNASQRRRYFSDYYYYYLYFWIFYGARSLIAAGHWRRRETTRAMASLFHHVSVCVRAHITDTGVPLVLTQPSAQQWPSVGRQQSSCSQRTFPVSLLRFSSFAKISSFGIRGQKQMLLHCLLFLRWIFSRVSCRFISSADSSEWNPPVQIKKSCVCYEKRKRRKDKENEKRRREI